MRKGILLVIGMLIIISGFSACKKAVDDSIDGSNAVEKEKDALIQGEKDLSGALRKVSPDDSLEGSLDRLDHPSWAQDKTPVTLDWFVGYDWFEKTFDPKINWGDYKLVANTGISLNIITGSLEDLNNLIANDNYPDIITYDVDSAIINRLENEGQFYPLDDLKEQFAPDMDVMESMIDWYGAEDGHWYRFASFFSGEERVNEEYGGFLASHNSNWVRGDILEEIGMSVEDLQTKEGFMEALLRVKEQNIQYKGHTVTPFMFEVWYEAVVTRFAEQFGADYEDSAGNYVNIIRQEEYVEALLYLNKMYRLELFSDEEFTMDKTQKDAKLGSGKVFAVNGLVATQYGSKELWVSDSNAKMIFSGVIQGGDSGVKPILMSTSSAGWSATVISRDSNYPDRAAQLLSYLSQEELMLDNTYGTGTYQVIEGRVIRDADKVAEEVADLEAYKAKYIFNLGLLLDSNVARKYTFKPDSWYLEEKQKSELNPTAIIGNSQPFYAISIVDGTELALIVQRVKAHIRQALPQILMASSEEECVALYEKFVEELDEIGMASLDDYQNERFHFNKERMNIEFAWPRNQ